MSSHSRKHVHRDVQVVDVAAVVVSGAEDAAVVVNYDVHIVEYHVAVVAAVVVSQGAHVVVVSGAEDTAVVVNYDAHIVDYHMAVVAAVVVSYGFL